MPGSIPTNVFVRARNSNRPTQWDVDLRTPPAAGSNARVVLGAGAGPENINFHLLPTPGTNITFDTANPIWVRQDSCPTQAGLDPQITVANTQPNMLSIRDENSVACELHYQLNFLGADPCDPIIINGGGGVGGGGNP